MKKALTIAGSDSGGGAGIQADLKTFTAFGVYGMSAITAITAQNTVGVQGIFELPVDIIEEQIKSIMSDIGTDAAKTGMLSSPEIVSTVAESIKKFNIPNIVVDPVMVAKSGDALLSENARMVMKENLLPLATVITPNLFEAEAILGETIKTIDDMKSAAVELKKIGCKWVVVKGGHLTGGKEAIDVVYNGKNFYLLSSPFVQTKNTHGTGCTFSSAIAAGLAKGSKPLDAIQKAKEYISKAIESSLSIGKGHGPTNHLAGIKSQWNYLR
jgi:hydroxymethylpyrimidine/phosphomethylpyrimidine kinase